MMRKFLKIEIKMSALQEKIFLIDWILKYQISFFFQID